MLYEVITHALPGVAVEGDGAVAGMPPRLQNAEANLVAGDGGEDRRFRVTAHLVVRECVGEIKGPGELLVGVGSISEALPQRLGPVVA